MPQDVGKVLAEAFGRTGATALQYSAEFRFLVQQHITELVQDLPSLHIKTRDYTQNDGRTVHLMLAEGTVPMYYQGVKYNIPVAIWLPERYPLAAPLAYVVPTPDMVIKPRHSFVDASGLVHTPYIGQWQYPSSNLREMAQDMSMHFGSDPPLFSKPKNWNPQAAAQQQQQQQPAAAHQGYAVYGNGAAGAGASDVFHAQNPLAQQSGSFHSAASGSSFTSGSGAAGAAAAAKPPASNDGMSFDSVWQNMMAAMGQQTQQAQPAPPPPPPPVAEPPPPPRENSTTKLTAAFRAAAAAALNKRLHASLSALAQQAAAQADEQLELQATLRQRGEQLQSEVAALQAERVALDKLSQDLSTSSAQLDKWLAENEHLAAAADNPSKLDPDAVISAADPLSQQALEVQAQDLALEDALYALDKALNGGSIEADAYLKQVRAVCRRQFYVRTAGNKVAAAQQEQQRHVAPPPHAAPERSLSAGRAVVLPQGDSWANAGVLSSRPPAEGWYPAT